MKVRRQMTLLMHRTREFHGEDDTVQYITVYENEFLSVIGLDYEISAQDDRQDVSVLKMNIGSSRDTVEAVVKSGIWSTAKSRDEKILEHRRVLSILKLMHLEGVDKKRVSHLSDFQLFRLAIARALFSYPRTIICNNPFYNVDSAFRIKMLAELHRVQKKTGVSIVYVTGEATEALRISDRIAIVHGNCIEQIGTPEEIYNTPVSRFVAKAVGINNVFEGYIRQEKDKTQIVMECGYIQATLSEFYENNLLYVAVRPECIRLTKECPENIYLEGRVLEYRFACAFYETRVQLADGREVVSFLKDRSYEIGQMVYLDWDDASATYMHTIGEPIYSTIEKLSKEVGNSLTISV